MLASPIGVGAVYSLFIRHVKHNFSPHFRLPWLALRTAPAVETARFLNDTRLPATEYTLTVDTSENEVSILILDNEAATQSALQQVFDSEGWRVQVVSNPAEAMAELAREHWTLVLVNVALANLNGPLYATLRELAHSDAVSEDGSSPLRVLFMTPKMAASWSQPALEKDRLPYVLKPFHLHDFLEKVSDLLMDVSAISEPIRSVKTLAPHRERRHREHRPVHGQMFASRDDYIMTEEELAEYDRQEEEERKKRQEAEKRREVL